MTDFPIMAQTEPKTPATPKWKPYQPLIVLVVTSGLMALVLNSIFTGFMELFMGFLLIEFGMVKFFDLGTFVMRFRQYDLIAAKAPVYAWLFPLIELLLGLAWLGNFRLIATSWIMLCVGIVSLAGILMTLQQGKKIKCACMGSSADMKLGTITVIENGLMIVMALLYIAGA